MPTLIMKKRVVGLENLDLLFTGEELEEGAKVSISRKKKPVIKEKPPEDFVPPGDFSDIEEHFIKSSDPGTELQKKFALVSPATTVVEPEKVYLEAELLPTPIRIIPTKVITETEQPVEPERETVGLAEWSNSPRCPCCGLPSVRGPFCRAHWWQFILRRHQPFQRRRK